MLIVSEDVDSVNLPSVILSQFITYSAPLIDRAAFVRFVQS